MPEWSEERKRAWSGAGNPRFGIAHTAEWKRKARQRMSGEANPFFGKSHSPKKLRRIRAGISKALKGRAPKLYQYGITDERYAAEMAAGNRWCCGDRKHFVPKDKIKDRGIPGAGGVCDDCVVEYRRRRKLRREYGVTPEWFDSKLREQGGCCALCNKTFDTEMGAIRNLCVDHDHITKKPRGILCRRCNSSLERAETIPGWLEKALAYLRSYATAV